MGEEATEVFAYIDAHFDDFVEDLSTYCAVPTVSAEQEGFAEGAEATQSLLERYGTSARRWAVPDGPDLVVGETGDEGPLLLLYNHYDVQPVDPLDEWDSDPFDPVVRGGKLFARGASDTKGNVVAQALAQRAIREVVGELPLRLRFMVEGEEEVSSPHLPPFWEAHPELFQGDGATIEGSGHTWDGSPVMQLGSKGILYVELSVATARIDQHSSLASAIPNPAWRLIAALNALRDEEGRIRIPGFYEGAHQPTEEELAYLERNRYDPLAFKETYGAVDVLGGETRLSRLKQMVYGNTCNIDGFYSGYIGDGLKTINPAYAKAKLDFRLLPGQRPKKILEALKAHLRAEGFGDVKVTDHGSFEPAATPLVSSLGQALLAGFRQAYGTDPNIFPWSMGSSSTWYYTSRGTPAGAAPGVGYAGSQVHAPNEHIRLEDARRSIKAVAATMMAFASA